MEVDGKAAVVTGGGTGVGRATALELARRGCSVLVNYSRSKSEAEATADEVSSLGVRGVAFRADVSEDSACRRMIETALSELGRLDILINNAGILRDRMLSNMSEAEWDAVIKVHLKGTFAPSQHAAAYWREESKAGRPVDARLINTSSVSVLPHCVSVADRVWPWCWRISTERMSRREPSRR